MSQIGASVARVVPAVSEELEVLKVVTGRLDASGIPYMVTGSMALNYYAVPRMTRDIDLVVELSVADTDRVCDLFQGDFYVEPETVRESVERRGTFNLIHTPPLGKGDLVVRKDTEDRRTEFTRRRGGSLGGRPLFFVWARDRLLSKARRGGGHPS